MLQIHLMEKQSKNQQERAIQELHALLEEQKADPNEMYEAIEIYVNSEATRLTIETIIGNFNNANKDKLIGARMITIHDIKEN